MRKLHKNHHGARMEQDTELCDTVEFFSEIIISPSFTAEYAENTEASENQSKDWNGLKTLRSPR